MVGEPDADAVPIGRGGWRFGGHGWPAGEGGQARGQVARQGRRLFALRQRAAQPEAGRDGLRGRHGEGGQSLRRQHVPPAALELARAIGAGEGNVESEFT